MTGMPAFDGRNERDAAAVTSATNVNASGVIAYLRAGLALVNVSLTTTGVLAVGADLFTLPVGYRPPVGVTVFADLVYTATDVPARVHILDTGVVNLQRGAGLPSGATLRGQIVVPL